jgi:hypothetical protein
VKTRPVWFAGLLVFVFAAVLFPLRSERLNRDLEGVFVAPDAMPRYDARTLAETFGVLAGPEKPRRLAYATSELTLDAVFRSSTRLLRAAVLAIFPAAQPLPDGTASGGGSRSACRLPRRSPIWSRTPPGAHRPADLWEIWPATSRRSRRGFSRRRTARRSPRR